MDTPIANTDTVVKHATIFEFHGAFNLIAEHSVFANSGFSNPVTMLNCLVDDSTLQFNDDNESTIDGIFEGCTFEGVIPSKMTGIYNGCFFDGVKLGKHKSYMPSTKFTECDFTNSYITQAVMNELMSGDEKTVFIDCTPSINTD